MVLFVNSLSTGWVLFCLCQRSKFSEKPNLNIFYDNEQNCWKHCAKWLLNTFILFIYLFMHALNIFINFKCL